MAGVIVRTQVQAQLAGIVGSAGIVKANLTTTSAPEAVIMNPVRPLPSNMALTPAAVAKPRMNSEATMPMAVDPALSDRRRSTANITSVT